MKSNLLLPILLCGLVMASGCTDTKDSSDIVPPDGTQFSKTFVQQYLMPSQIRLTEIRQALNDPSVRCIRIAFDGELYNPESDRFGTLSSTFGDTSFNNYLVPFSNLALAEVVGSIGVRWTSINAEARSLDGVARLATASPYEFIRNGYHGQTGTFPAELALMGCYKQYGYRPVFKFVNDLGAEDLTLLAYQDCYLFLPADVLATGGTLEVLLTFGMQTLSATSDIAPAQ